MTRTFFTAHRKCCEEREIGSAVNLSFGLLCHELCYRPKFKLTRYQALCALPSLEGLCYNGAAVNEGVKQQSATPEAEEHRSHALSAGTVPAGNAGHEDASRYCPVCSRRLESRRCKLICNVCGYYMSCADYY